MGQPGKEADVADTIYDLERASVPSGAMPSAIVVRPCEVGFLLWSPHTQTSWQSYLIVSICCYVALVLISEAGQVALRRKEGPAPVDIMPSTCMRAHRGFYEGDLGYVYDRLETPPCWAFVPSIPLRSDLPQPTKDGGPGKEGEAQLEHHMGRQFWWLDIPSLERSWRSRRVYPYTRPELILSVKSCLQSSGDFARTRLAGALLNVQYDKVISR